MRHQAKRSEAFFHVLVRGFLLAQEEVVVELVSFVDQDFCLVEWVSVMVFVFVAFYRTPIFLYAKIPIKSKPTINNIAPLQWSSIVSEPSFPPASSVNIELLST